MVETINNIVAYLFLALTLLIIGYVAMAIMAMGIGFVKTHLEKRKSRCLRTVYPTGDRIGKWIVLSDRTVRCPYCGKVFYDAYDQDFADRFCRNCGECMDDGKEDRNK